MGVYKPMNVLGTNDSLARLSNRIAESRISSARPTPPVTDKEESGSAAATDQTRATGRSGIAAYSPVAGSNTWTRVEGKSSEEPPMATTRPSERTTGGVTSMYGAVSSAVGTHSPDSGRYISEAVTKPSGPTPPNTGTEPSGNGTEAWFARPVSIGGSDAGPLARYGRGRSEWTRGGS